MHVVIGVSLTVTDLATSYMQFGGATCTSTGPTRRRGKLAFFLFLFFPCGDENIVFHCYESKEDVLVSRKQFWIAEQYTYTRLELEEPRVHCLEYWVLGFYHRASMPLPLDICTLHYTFFLRV